MFSLCLLLPLAAQETQVLPEPGTPPTVDTITPVPLPEIPFGSIAIMEPMIPKELNINNQGGTIEGNIETGIRFGGPVKIVGDNGLEIFSDTAVLDLKQKSVTLIGGVSIYQGNTMQRGSRAVYYYERKFLDVSGMRASMDPILLESGKFIVEQRNGKQVYVGENAGITADDVEIPGYWFRSKKTTVYPGEKVVFNSMRIYAGDTPIFWFPYLSQPLDPNLGYHFLPGARSPWGAFLLNSYGVMLDSDSKDPWLLSRWHLDLRTRRGIGTGLDLVDMRLKESKELTGLSLYHLFDLAPETNTTGVTRGHVSNNRYAISLKHRLAPKWESHADWRIDSNLTLLSDNYYLEDFDVRQYRINPAPDNTLGIYRRDDTSLLSLYTRFRINDFYRADTRLPEISFDQSRRPLFDLPILHEGSTSFGIIGEQAADLARTAIIDPLLSLPIGDPSAPGLLDQLSGYERLLAAQIIALPAGDPRREALSTQLRDSSYARFNTNQEFSLPMTFGGFLNFTPQAGAGYTRYDAVSGPRDNMDRSTLHFGAESSVKFSQDFSNYQNAGWGINGLKHVIQPYVTWSIVSTNDYDLADPMVDRLTPTTRPRPIDPARFTATDSLQSWNILRFGARNQLITKRDNQSFEWLFLDTYMDAFIRDPEGQRNCSNLYNDLRWQPLPWMGVDVESQVPIISGGTGFNEFATSLHFMPADNFDFSLGYRWLSDHPALTDSNLFNLQTYTRLTDNWGFGTSHVLELDDGTMELQQCTIHRDMGNWVLSVGISQRDNRLKKEYGLVLSLTLKGFPAGMPTLNMNTL